MLDTQTLVSIIIITLGVMVAVVVLLYGFMQLLIPMESNLNHRLASVTEEAKFSRNKKSGELHQVLQTLVQLFQPVSKKMYGGNQKYLDRIRRTLVESGEIPSDEKVWKILATQLLVGIVMGLVCGVIGFVAVHTMIGTLVGVIGGILAGRYLSEFKLKARAKNRKEEIHRAIPDVLDLLVICVEAGLGIDAAIRRVAEESLALAPDLSYELSRLSGELGAGIPRTDAFNNLGTRTGVNELHSLCSMIIQADKLGTSISKALRIYSDDLRTRRRQAAEELGHKASVKMIFPLVILIFPALFFVLMGPAVIRAIEQFM